MLITVTVTAHKKKKMKQQVKMPVKANHHRKPVSKGDNSPFFSVHQGHGLETGPVFYLPCHWLWPLNPALGHVKGNVYYRGNGASTQTYQKPPEEINCWILVRNIKPILLSYLKTEKKKKKQK